MVEQLHLLVHGPAPRDFAHARLPLGRVDCRLRSAGSVNAAALAARTYFAAIATPMGLTAEATACRATASVAAGVATRAHCSFLDRLLGLCLPGPWSGTYGHAALDLSYRVDGLDYGHLPAYFYEACDDASLRHGRERVRGGKEVQ